MGEGGEYFHRKERRENQIYFAEDDIHGELQESQKMCKGKGGGRRKEWRKGERVKAKKQMKTQKSAIYGVKPHKNQHSEERRGNEPLKHKTMIMKTKDNKGDDKQNKSNARARKQQEKKLVSRARRFFEDNSNKKEAKWGGREREKKKRKGKEAKRERDEIMMMIEWR